MRSAESRVAVTEAMEEAMDGARGVYERFSLPRGYVKAGVVAAAGLVGTLVLRRLFSTGSRRIAAAPGTIAPAHNGTALLYLAIQVASALLLPWVKSRLEGAEWGEMVKKWHPSHIFFRWLGLEK